MKLEGKRIIVTGATSGIGKEIVKLLIKFESVTIVAASINEDGTSFDNTNIIPVKCDVSTKEEIDRLFEVSLEKMGAIDIVFANAGFAYYEKIHQPDYEKIEKIYKTNVFAPIYIIEKMAMLNSFGDYRVVATASAMAMLPLPGYALYSSTKAAIHSFIKGYRYQMDNPKKVIAVYPIATKTNFFRSSADNAPVAFPTQSPTHVAKSIISGVIKNKKSIFPSFLFVTMYVIDRVFPLATKLYSFFENRKFKHWCNEKYKNEEV